MAGVQFEGKLVRAASELVKNVVLICGNTLRFKFPTSFTATIQNLLHLNQR
jgi:hypothetical protein